MLLLRVPEGYYVNVAYETTSRMNRTRTVVAVALVVLFVAGGATLVAANDTARGEPDIEAFAPETAFVPGEEATLSVTLNNRGDLRDDGFDNLEAEVITAHEATLRVLSADETTAVDEVPFDVRTEEQPIGDVGQGVTGPVDFTVVPDEDAEPGVYTVPLEIDYRDVFRAEQDDGATIRSQRDETETLLVDVEITDRAQFAVVDVDGDVQAGTSGTVDVTMRNVADGVAREASVTASPVDPDLSFTSGAGATDTFVDRWEPGEERTFTYRLSASSDATLRPSTFELDVEYRDDERADAVARTVRTGLTPTAEQSFDATGLNSTLSVGENGAFEAEVVNEGPYDVEDVVVVFDNDAPAIQGVADDPLPTDPNVDPLDTQVTVGELAVGESETVRFEAGIGDDAATGNRTLNVVTRYRTPAGTLEASDPLDVVVDVIEQSFSVSGGDSTLRVGDDGSFEATVVNEGDRDVEGLVVVFDNEAPAVEGVTEDPLPTDPNVVPRETQATIGELAVGESATVSFDAGIRTDAVPGNRTLNVATRHRTPAGDISVSDPFDVVVEVAEEEDVFAVEPATPATTPENATAGDTVRYDVVVENTGSDPIRNVQAKLFVDDPLDATDDEAFVTSLDPDETTTVSFEVEIDGDAASKAYAASVDFRYDDVDGDTELSDTYRIPFEVVDGEENGILAFLGDVSPPVVVGALGVFALVGVTVWKRGRITAALGDLRHRLRRRFG